MTEPLPSSSTGRRPILRPIGFRPEHVSALINSRVVEQHAEEAAFLWCQRDNAACSPGYKLADLALLDERVEAHLDGLRVAGDAGWECCKVGLEMEAPGEVFAAAVIAFETEDERRIDKVLEVGASSTELQPPLVAAAGWMEFEQARPVLDDLLGSELAEIRRVGIAGYSAHRVDPGIVLTEVLANQDADPRLRARAAKAAAELGRVDLLGQVVGLLSSPDADCRFYGAWAGTRLGARDEKVVAMLRQVAEEGGAYAERSVDMAIRCMEPPQARAWIDRLHDRPDTVRLAAVGMGALGDPASVGDLIDLMGTEEIARIAGGAFAMLTGLDLAYEDLAGDAPEAEDADEVRTDDVVEEDLSLSSDDDHDWPLPDEVAAWWSEHRNEYDAGKRYLRGREITTDSLRHALVHGTQRERAAASLELAIRAPSEPLFETRERADRQKAKLQEWSS